MISDFSPSDLNEVDPSRFSQVKRLSAGTSGIVFRAVERRTGDVVAVKISLPEESSKLCLLNEEAALRAIGAIQHNGSGGAEPVARKFRDRFDPLGRVGLVLEWLDNSFTPVEELVRDPGVHLTSLQILRIIAPFVHMLAKAHEAGFVYGDIGEDKADHLWWRIKRQPDSKWVVPRKGGKAEFQLKVIDWANATNMDNAAYRGDITPATDIAGVGRLMFYMWRGPDVPLPASAEDRALNDRRDSRLPTIIRRAMFCQEEGGFVADTQHDMDFKQRAAMWRDPAQRAIPAKDLLIAIQDTIDELEKSYQGKIKLPRSIIQSIDSAAASGLLELNGQITDKLLALNRSKASAHANDLAKQAQALLEELEGMRDQVVDIDPDHPDTDELSSDLERLTRLFDERRRVERVYNFLRDLQNPLDKNKMVFNAITLGRQPGTDWVLKGELDLLEHFAYAIFEAGQRSEGLDVDKESGVLANLVDNALSQDPAKRIEARNLVLQQRHWGDGPKMHALRLLLARRAGAPILRDQIRDLLNEVAEIKSTKDRDSTSTGISKRTRESLEVEARDLGMQLSSVEAFLKQLDDADRAQQNMSLSHLGELYAAVENALAKLLTFTGSITSNGGEDLYKQIQTAIAEIKQLLVQASSHLDKGDLKQAVGDLRAWSEQDPQSKLASRYIDIVQGSVMLGLGAVRSTIEKGNCSELEALLKALQSKAEELLTLTPTSAYLLCARSLVAVVLPLVGIIDTRALAALPDQLPPRGEDRRLLFGKSVLEALKEALVSALENPVAAGFVVVPTSTASATTSPVPLAERLSSDLRDKLVETYKEIRNWQSPWSDRYPRDANSIKDRIPQLLKDRLASVERQLPAMKLICDTYRWHVATACIDHGIIALQSYQYDSARAWFTVGTNTAHATGMIASAAQAGQKLIAAIETCRDTGPESAQKRLDTELTAAIGQSDMYKEWLAEINGDFQERFQKMANVLGEARAILGEAQAKAQSTNDFWESIDSAIGHLWEYKSDAEPWSVKPELTVLKEILDQAPHTQPTAALAGINQSVPSNSATHYDSGHIQVLVNSLNAAISPGSRHHAKVRDELANMVFIPMAQALVRHREVVLLEEEKQTALHKMGAPIAGRTSIGTPGGDAPVTPGPYMGPDQPYVMGTPPTPQVLPSPQGNGSNQALVGPESAGNARVSAAKEQTATAASNEPQPEQKLLGGIFGNWKPIPLGKMLDYSNELVTLVGLLITWLGILAIAAGYLIYMFSNQGTDLRMQSWGLGILLVALSIVVLAWGYLRFLKLPVGQTATMTALAVIVVAALAYGSVSFFHPEGLTLALPWQSGTQGGTGTGVEALPESEASGPERPAATPTSEPQPTVDPVLQKVDLAIRDRWAELGGKDVLGEPLSNPVPLHTAAFPNRTGEGWHRQYFTNAVVDWNGPTNIDVPHLGIWWLESNYGSNNPGEDFFPDGKPGYQQVEPTNKYLGGALGEKWRSLARNVEAVGHPITNEFTEHYKSGATHTVQYFERAVLQLNDNKVVFLPLGSLCLKDLKCSGTQPSVIGSNTDDDIVPVPPPPNPMPISTAPPTPGETGQDRNLTADEMLYSDPIQLDSEQIRSELGAVATLDISYTDTLSFVGFGVWSNGEPGSSSQFFVAQADRVNNALEIWSTYNPEQHPNEAVVSSALRSRLIGTVLTDTPIQLESGGDYPNNAPIMRLHSIEKLSASANMKLKLTIRSNGITLEATGDDGPLGKAADVQGLGSFDPAYVAVYFHSFGNDGRVTLEQFTTQPPGDFKLHYEAK